MGTLQITSNELAQMQQLGRGACSTLQKSTELQSMANENKIEQMKRKMDGKSMEDDL